MNKYYTLIQDKIIDQLTYNLKKQWVYVTSLEYTGLIDDYVLTAKLVMVGY